MKNLDIELVLVTLLKIPVYAAWFYLGLRWMYKCSSKKIAFVFGFFRVVVPPLFLIPLFSLKGAKMTGFFISPLFWIISFVVLNIYMVHLGKLKMDRLFKPLAWIMGGAIISFIINFILAIFEVRHVNFC
ncbi:hypothetical protein K1X76_04460 [bacterium]|nr:hypothetical protein [bacterium]